LSAQIHDRINCLCTLDRGLVFSIDGIRGKIESCPAMFVLFVKPDIGKTEVHFHCGEHLDRLSGFHPRRELPFVQRRQSLLLQAEAHWTQDPDIGCPALFVHYKFKDQSSLNLSLAGLMRVLWLNSSSDVRRFYSRTDSDWLVGWILSRT